MRYFVLCSLFLIAVSAQNSVPAGRCGKDFGFATCEKYPGEYCCSEYGWCGGTADHCNPQTCQFGCDNRNPRSPGRVPLPPPTSSPSPTARPTTSPRPSPTSPPSVPQGRCGREFGGAFCNYPGEYCCSEYGWCGNTPSHCGTGCQSGCDNRPPQGPPSQLPEVGEDGAILSCKIPGSISITYDDGPSEFTSTLLDTLRSLNVKTTFFVVGQYLEDESNRQLLARAVREGHEIASHSYSHTSFLQLSDQQIRDEMTKTEDLILRAIGRRPRLFRPPYGEMDGRVASVVGRLGYRVIKWNIDSNDWRHPDDYAAYETEYRNALSNTDPASRAFISLQHDIHAGTVRFAKQIHEFTIRTGYKPQKVSTCLEESAYK